MLYVIFYIFTVMKLTRLKYLLIFNLVGIVTAFANTAPGPPVPEPALAPPTPPPLPVDMYVWILFLGAIIYGFLKINKDYKSQKNF